MLWPFMQHFLVWLHILRVFKPFAIFLAKDKEMRGSSRLLKTTVDKCCQNTEVNVMIQDL